MELTDDGKAAGRNGSLLSSAAARAAAPPFAGFSFLTPPRHFDLANPEWIDRAATDPQLLREELLVLARANQRFGIHKLILQYVAKLAPAPAAAPVTVLDLGTGGADIPRAIAAWFRQRGQSVSITAVDRNPEVLRAAAEWCRDWPEIHFEPHDLLALPFAPASFDLVLCSHALHHFGSADAARVLRRAWEISRAGCLVSDLRRNWPAIWFIQLAARTLIKSTIVRHDAPQSCRAAFTVDELRSLAGQAGWRNFTVNRHHSPFRMVLEAAK